MKQRTKTLLTIGGTMLGVNVLAVLLTLWFEYFIDAERATTYQMFFMILNISAVGWLVMTVLIVNAYDWE